MQLELGELDLRYAQLRIVDGSRQRRLVASLLEHGQLTVLLDGYVRVAALAELARDLVDVAVLEVPEADALVLTHGLDNGRERTALEEGWLLDRAPSWVSRRLALVEALPEAVQESVRVGKVSVQVATKILVPLARANAEACERIVGGLGSERASVRQMTRLYVAWKEADDEVRERLCAQPRLFLKTPEAEPEDDEAAATLKDLSVLAAVCLRLCRRAAFHAGMSGAGVDLPQGGIAFVSVGDNDKAAVIPVVKHLRRLGFSIYATRGTAYHLRESGIACETVNKVLEGRPHIVDRMVNGEIAVVINTSLGEQAARDSLSIRRTALAMRIPYFTTIAGAHAAAIESARVGGRVAEAVSLQEYHQRPQYAAGEEPTRQVYRPV